MSDEQSTEQETTEPKVTVAVDTTESVEKLKADLEKWRSLSRKNEDRAKENAEAAKAWAEYQEANKSEEEKRASELEQLRDRAAELENELSKKDRAILVERVAASKGVPARYLHGDSEDDLLASADQFLEDAKTLAAAKPAGIIPSSGTGSPTASASSLEDVRERAKRFAGK